MVINGNPYQSLKTIEKYLQPKYLYKTFQDDFCSKIHGDLTIENLVCINDPVYPKGYYLIDPNTGNILNSPNLDYAKLLQSLHGKYEFLMNAQQVNIDHNRIEFLAVGS